jgi:hypothetical protein
MATFCGLAGVSVAPPGGEPNDVPASDSINVWAALSTPNASASPRTEVPLAFCANAETDCDEGGGGTGADGGDSALIVQQPDGTLLKFINGTQGFLGWWQGPLFPNASSMMPGHDAIGTCVGGCLFDLSADPTEHVDLRHARPAAFAKLARRMAAIGATVYQTDYDAGYDHCLSAPAAHEANHGFLAPRCTKQAHQ